MPRPRLFMCGTNRRSPSVGAASLVRSRRLELPRVAPQRPQRCASTNSATTARGEPGRLADAAALGKRELSSRSGLTHLRSMPGAAIVSQNTFLRGDDAPVAWATSPGLVDYPSAVAAMEARARAIADGEAGELVWLLEHPPLYSAGRLREARRPADAGPLPGVPDRARGPVHLPRARAAGGLRHARPRRPAEGRPRLRRRARGLGHHGPGRAGRREPGLARSDRRLDRGSGGRRRREDRRHRRAPEALGQLSWDQPQRRAGPRALHRHHPVRPQRRRRHEPAAPGGERRHGRDGRGAEGGLHARLRPDRRGSSPL